MAGIHRHQNIIENSERELVAERVLHQGEVQAKSHSILMTFTVIRSGRKRAATVKVDIEAEILFEKDADKLLEMEVDREPD